MAQITPNLMLTVWNNLSDPYDSGQLVDNFVKIDLHDHSGAGKGLQIDGATGILANTIGTQQIATNGVGSVELSSSSTSDTMRAVGVDHIQDKSITGSKIANGTLTIDKFSQETFIPKVYHMAATGSLPTVTVTGSKPLYDGYTIDYAFSTTSTGTQYSAALTTSSTNLNADYIWRLRYNGKTGYWDPVGGNGFHAETTTPLTGSAPTEGSMYVYWGGGAFQSFVPPLRGAYKVELFFSADVEQTKINYAIVKGAIYQGNLPDPNNNPVIPLSSIGSYSYIPGIVTGDTDQTSTISTAAIIPVSSNTSAASNCIRQCFGASKIVNVSQQTGGDIVLSSQRLYVMPHHSLRNYDS